MAGLFSEKKDEKGVVRLQMNPIGKLFSDANHFVNVRVCQNPICDCGVVNLAIVKEENLGTSDIEYRLPVDIHKQEVRSQYHKDFYAKQAASGGYLSGLFANGLTKEDWHSIRQQRFNHKSELVKHVNPDEIDFEFEEEHYKSLTMMFCFQDAFPFTEFYAKINGKTYIIFDTYCKNPTCMCSDMILQIYEIIITDDEANETKHAGDYYYDYKTKKGEIKVGNRAIVLPIVEQIFDNLDNPGELLGRRQQVIKKLYTKSRKTYSNEYKPKSISKKISRNQLCPCGSGKKYKRCCLKKDEALG